MSNWTLTVPQEVINLVSNPSLETNTTDWAASGATPGAISQSATRAYRGRYSLRVVPDASDNNGGKYTLAGLAATTVYTASVYVYANSGVPMRFEAVESGGAQLEDVTWTGAGSWKRQVITFTTGAITTVDLRIWKMTSASIIGFYVDALQVEQASYHTDYVDGTQPGCRWRGTRHASTSIREASYRGAGREYDLADLGVSVLAWAGIGTPPYAHNVTAQGGQFGQPTSLLYQGSQAKVRPIVLTLWAKGSSVANLHALRSELVRAVVPDRLSRQQEWLLRTDVAGTTVEIPVIYDTGLEHVIPKGYAETIQLRLLALDPYWRGIKDEAATLDVQDTGTATLVAGRVSGHWETLGPPSAVAAGDGGTTLVDVVAVGPDGCVYFGGDFKNFDGIANADGIVKWDPITELWSALGTGAVGAAGSPMVQAITFDPAGNLYAGGNFTSMGGVANTAFIAMWDGSVWSALGTGLNGTCRAITIGNDSTVYATGDFTTAGGGAAVRIAAWDGSAWSALSSGLTFGNGYALVTGADGAIYVGGTFTVAGGVTVNRVARWDGATFDDLADGMADNGVFALAIDRAGYLYAGGSFTAAGAVSAAGIASWNGTSWTALSSGVAGGPVEVIATGPDGYVYAGGDFTSAGGLDLCDALARWNSTSWAHIGIDLPGTPHVYGLAATSYGDLYVGFDTNATKQSDGAVTVTNEGSAKAYPVIVLERDGGSGVFTLQNILNATTGEELLFNLDIIDGEIITIDLALKEITSNFRKNVSYSLMPTSMLGSWGLQPGENTICAFVDGASAASVMTAFLLWRTPFVSADL